MIIEVTGEPGVGKTTLLCDVCNKIYCKPILFTDDLVLKHFKLNFIAPVFLRRVSSDIILFLIFLPHFKKYKNFLLYALNILRNISERRTFKINILRNIILKFGRFEFISKNFTDKVVLIDEGISHIPFNLVDYSGKRNVDLESVFTLLAPTTSRIKIVVMCHNSVNIEHHLMQRGHKRMKQNPVYSLDQFVRVNKQLVELYKLMPQGMFLDKSVLEVGDEQNRGDIVRFFERIIDE